MRFIGSEAIAARRAEKCLQLRRLPDGFWRPNPKVTSPMNREIGVYTYPDKRPKQLRTEFGGRRLLNAFRAVHPNGAATLTCEPVRSLSSGSHVPESCHSLRLPAMPRRSFSGMLLLSASFRSVSLRSSLHLIPTWAARALCSGRPDRTKIPSFVTQGRSLPSLGMPELFATTTPKFGRGSLGCSGNS